MAGYVACFIALFILAGLGNGSVYKMIPTVFGAASRTLDLSETERREWARLISGLVIGFVAGSGHPRRGRHQPGAAPVLRQHRHDDVGILDLHGLLSLRGRADLGQVRSPTARDTVGRERAGRGRSRLSRLESLGDAGQSLAQSARFSGCSISA